MDRWQSIVATTFSAWALGTSPVFAANATATDPAQDSASRPAEAQEPRLPAAKDTHRTGPTQDETGSGAVAGASPNADERTTRTVPSRTSAERAERNETGAKPPQTDEQRPLESTR